MTEKYELRLCSNGEYYLWENNVLLIPHISFDTFNKESAKELISILNVQEELRRELETENKQLNQFINRLTTKGTGRIDLANGYSYKINAVLTDFCGDGE